MAAKGFEESFLCQQRLYFVVRDNPDIIYSSSQDRKEAGESWVVP